MYLNFYKFVANGYFVYYLDKNLDVDHYKRLRFAWINKDFV